MFKAFQAINGVVGALASLAVLAVVVVGGWFGFKTYYSEKWDMEKRLQEREAKIEDLNRDLEAKQREITKLATAIRLLKVDHRIGHLEILKQEGSEKAGDLTTTFQFVEVDRDGKPLEKPREFTVKGDIIHVDALVVKFDDKNIEEADPLRSTSLCLFKRIYGDKQKPSEGFAIDREGSQPAAYRSPREMSDFEREIWGKFWDYANDEERSAKAGIRAAHGQGVYQKVLPGKRYKIMLRSSGDLWIRPEDLAPKGTEASL